MLRAAITMPAGHMAVAYNSCRNRHCPKCQGAAARDWLADRKAELLPVGYFHVVFTLPAPIADIAFYNKRVVYNILLKASAEAMLTIAADPKHLGAKIAITSVLHTWGSAMTPTPPCAHDRARRRIVGRWLTMDLMPDELPRSRQSAVTPLSATVP